VTVAFDSARPLDGVKADVKVAQARLELKEFNVRRVGPVVVVEQGQLGEELKAMLQEDLKAREPMVKDYANQALARAVKEDKGLLLKLIAPKK
jgi:hypothetical protein